MYTSVDLHEWLVDTKRGDQACPRYTHVSRDHSDRASGALCISSLPEHVPGALHATLISVALKVTSVFTNPEYRKNLYPEKFNPTLNPLLNLLLLSLVHHVPVHNLHVQAFLPILCTHGCVCTAWMFVCKTGSGNILPSNNVELVYKG